MSGRGWAAAFGVWVGFAAVGMAAEAINLETALRLAGARNVAIEMARVRLQEAEGRLSEERQALWPWLAPGIGYRRHDGNVQDVSGNVFDASKQSAAAGLGVVARVELGDAIYRVLAGRQSVAAVEAQTAVRRREILLAVATAYTELCRATAARATADEATRLSRETLEQLRGAVAAGIAFAGDAQRAEVHLGQNEARRLEARLAVRLASARLATALRLPPGDLLHPALNEFVPILLVSTNLALDSLVGSALARRPELSGADALVGAARARRDGAAKGPWLPSVGAQAGWGVLGGGRNNSFGDVDGYQDFGVELTWRVGPGGIGDRARRRTAGAGLRVAELEQEQLREIIVREVVEARSRAESAAEQVSLAARNVESARRLHELTRARREFGVGAVLEAIEAERELTRALMDSLQAVAAHNASQWELWHAIGQDESISSIDR